MAETTTIEWCDATYNPWRGCNPVSEGCANCYARRFAARRREDFKVLRRASVATFRLPERMKAGRVVFVCSLSDFFHEGADEWRREAWEVMSRAPQHFYLLLTKRPENVAARLPEDWPWANVGLGITAENQARLKERAPVILSIPAALYFLSWEPGLGALDLNSVGEYRGEPMSALDIIIGLAWERNAFKWVIAGGESGPNGRALHPDWVRSLRNQCAAADVPFLFKQWGEWAKQWGKWMPRNLTAGRELDGVVHDGRPQVITDWLKKA